MADVSGTQFWRYPFVNLCSPKRFVEFMVMQVDIIPEKDRPHRVPVSNKVLYPRDRSCPPPPQPSPSHRALIMTNKSLLWTCFIMDHCWYLQHVLADLWVSKVTENGLSDHQYFCRTHLGHLLSPGDTVYGCVRTVSLYYWVIDIIYTRINNFIKHGEAIQYFTFGFINFIVHCTSVLHVQFCNTLYFHRFDFTNANLNNPDLEKVKAEKLPDVVSIRPWCMIISMQNKYLDINSH